eukprot:TRINITY_DN1881_c2_g1_i1.p1 TRINITY_DN1881_c2_g1~~TRINITY_DN1881_c2_g1_i1.p1  ORF type:complete len:632 (+),score=204.23 TRINITY_DN1881_c2_g1_i1:63-1958(+)
MRRLLKEKLLQRPSADGALATVTAEDREVWAEAVRELVSGEAPATVKASVLTALSLHGESSDVIDVFREVLSSKAVACPVPSCCDIVGTGGDGKNTFNISTPASIIAAAAGLRLAKHGNRSASAATGSADVAEHLGGCLMLSPEQVAAVVDRCGFCFVFAPQFHPELRHVGPLRKELGFRTIFNLLGPVLNPCGPEHMIVGVGERSKAEIIAGALARRPGRALVVHSTDGLDKISPACPTHSWLVAGGKIEYKLLQPADFGLSESASKDYYVGGGGTVPNAARVLDVVTGRETGPLSDFVFAQVAALAHVSGRAATMADGMRMAREAVSSGRAATVLDDYVRTSTQQAKGKSTDILARILRRRTVDLAVARSLVPEEEVKAEAEKAPPAVCLFARLAEHGNEMGVLAELKRASPSEGDIDAAADTAAVALSYARAGVQAISVLTEPVWFKGSLDDLRRVRQVTSEVERRPVILRKDFVFSKYQVLEARAAGADSVLLIVAATDTMTAHGETLGGLIQFSRSLGMEPLVEVVTEEEVDAAVEAGARVVGVNNRDLKTFRVDLGRTGELVQYAKRVHPESAMAWIGLSGVSDTVHVDQMRAGGATAVLVGTTLMRSKDPAQLIKEYQNPRPRQ